MQKPTPIKRQTPRTWLIPAIVAAILFIGAVASNLVATYVQPSLEPYRRWVWGIFIVALFVAIAFAIREARWTGESGEPNPTPDNRKIDGDVVTRDKITHIYQTQSPAIATALHQLPPPEIDFTGRTDELAELTTKLEQGGVTICCLHGLGGIGKTALALKLADQLTSRYPDAQFYLNLKGDSREPLAVTEALAHVVRAYHPSTKPPETEAGLRGLYRSVLRGQRAMLLMDNAAGAEQVEPLIPPAGSVLLVTSRQHFTLTGLFAKKLEALSPTDARELLMSIAPKVGDQADEIAALCGFLPLALRLAGSALVKFVNVGPAEYAQRLQDEQRRLKLIDASLNLSYELLSEELQKYWRFLAVFPETFEEGAVAAVWNVKRDRAQDTLGELIAASVLEWNEASRRYRLHDLARLFAASQLESEERAKGKELHAAHYVKVLTAATDLYVKGGDAVRNGLAIFDLEWKNIATGQAWAEAEAGANDQAADICISYVAKPYLLDLRQHPRERIGWLKAAVNAARRLNQRTREGEALANLGLTYWELGETERAVELQEQYLAIAREMADRKGEGNALGNLGHARAAGGDSEGAIGFYQEQLTIAREIGDRRGEGNALLSLGLAHATLRKIPEAIKLCEQSLEIARAIGDRRCEGAALVNLGLAYWKLGETARAVELYEQQLVIAREIGDRRGEAIALFNLSVALNKSGDREQAINQAEESFNIFAQIEDPNAAKVRAKLDEWQAPPK